MDEALKIAGASDFETVKSVLVAACILWAVSHVIEIYRKATGIIEAWQAKRIQAGDYTGPERRHCNLSEDDADRISQVQEHQKRISKSLEEASGVLKELAYVARDTHQSTREIRDDVKRLIINGDSR